MKKLYTLCATLLTAGTLTAAAQDLSLGAPIDLSTLAEGDEVACVLHIAGEKCGSRYVITTEQSMSKTYFLDPTTEVAPEDDFTQYTFYLSRTADGSVQIKDRAGFFLTCYNYAYFGTSTIFTNTVFNHDMQSSVYCRTFTAEEATDVEGVLAGGFAYRLSCAEEPGTALQYCYNAPGNFSTAEVGRLGANIGNLEDAFEHVAFQFMRLGAESVPAVDVEAWRKSQLAAIGCVGGYPQEAYDDLQAVETEDEMADFLASHAVIELQSGMYYRLQSACPDSTATNFERYASNNIVSRLIGDFSATLTAEEAAGDASTLFRFVADGDGYRLESEGYALSTISYETPAYLLYGEKAELEAGVYVPQEMSQVGAGIWALECTNSPDESYRFLYANSDTYLTSPALQGWTCSAAETHSQWRIRPAESLILTLAGDGEGHFYGTLYHPFAVQLPAGVQTYRATKAWGHEVYLSEVEQSLVPALTPVLIRSTEPTVEIVPVADASFTEEEAAAWQEDNIFQGVLTSTTPGSARLVLTETADGGVKFIQGADIVIDYDDETTMVPDDVCDYPLNYACIALADVEEPAEVEDEPLALDFYFGIWTSIRSVETSEASAADGTASGVTYDLFGRRVMRPAAGLYVRDGRKVLIN